MNKEPTAVVQEMFRAFGTADLERFKQTVSEDTVWIYHGTHRIPKATFSGKDGAARFISNILNSTEILKFEPQQWVAQGNMVVVIGEEHQRVKKSGEELKQRWVQVYTVDNNLITRMEEFATTEDGQNPYSR